MVLLTTSCSRPPEAVDLLAAARTRLVEASVPGGDVAWVRQRAGLPVRIHGVVRASLPATPPSRLVFRLDVPRGGRLTLAAGVLPTATSGPVHFSVKLRRAGAEHLLASRVVDPADRAEDGQWVPLEADLAPHAGRDVELVLETDGRGGSGGGEVAAWGTPVIALPHDTRAPLAIVYLVDTLRADHLSLYGYARDTSPELARFASDAVVFEQAIASSSWTMPSVASLFTSLLPEQHGSLQYQMGISPSAVTLAERMAGQGYATGAVIANPLLFTRGTGFDRGFAYFAGMHGRRGRVTWAVPAGRVVDEALRFLDTTRGRPTLLYVHTFDPHAPYAPPPPFDRRFLETPPGPEAARAAEARGNPDPADRDLNVALYDGEIAYGDQEFGRFLRELRERGLYDRALVVFVSDHGEEFLDHGGWRHGCSLFDELVRVPLVVKLPGNRNGGRRVKRQVQLLDVLPTVLESQSLAVPTAPAPQGRSLQAAMRGDGPEPPALLQLSHRGIVAYGVRSSREKYVRSLGPADDEGYYDLERDPREQVNRRSAAGPRADALRRMVEASMMPSRYRQLLRVEGAGAFELRLRTSGWIVGVETHRLGTAERAQLDREGRVLTLSLHPRAGQPREVAFQLRPHGVPLWIDGRRDGRRLRPGDIHIGSVGEPSAVPFKFPEADETPGVFAAPPGRPGLGLWVTLVKPDEGIVDLDSEAREQLRALGY